MDGKNGFNYGAVLRTTNGSMTGIRPYPPASPPRREKSSPIATSLPRRCLYVILMKSPKWPTTPICPSIQRERATDRCVPHRRLHEGGGTAARRGRASGVRNKTLSRSRVKRERTWRSGSLRTRTYAYYVLCGKSPFFHGAGHR